MALHPAVKAFRKEKAAAKKEWKRLEKIANKLEKRLDKAATLRGKSGEKKWAALGLKWQDAVRDTATAMNRYMTMVEAG